jgi:hypothetical protein
MKHTLIKLADAAMEKAADNVQRLHQQSGYPLVIWQNGRVVSQSLKTGTVSKIKTSRKIAKRSSSVGLK